MGNSDLYKCSEQPTKSKVNFNYNGTISIIQCLKNDKMKQICEKFAFKSALDFDSLYFLYNGGKIDFNLTFYEQANSLDKKNLEMNVIAFSDVKNQIELKCPNCQHLLNVAEIKDFYKLINYNKNIDKMLIDLKSQIKTENSNMEKLINDIIKENKKSEKELENLLRDDNFEKNKKIQTYNFKEIYDDITYKNFDIKLKETIHINKEEKRNIYSATILKDGRFAISIRDSSDDKHYKYNIIIYDNKTFEPNLKIKQNQDVSYNLSVLSSGILACCNSGNIILYIIKKKTYEVVQTINKEGYNFYYIMELNNKRLISLSREESLFLYFFYEKNNKYSEDYNFYISEYCNCGIIQIKENEICYLIKKRIINISNDITSLILCFFDLLERKQIKEIDICYYNVDPFMNMITKDLLLIAHCNSFFLINIDQYKMVRQMEMGVEEVIPGFSCLCVLSENVILTGDYGGAIKQWKIEGNEITLFSSKQIAHNWKINAILKLGEGRILSTGYNDGFKIW